MRKFMSLLLCFLLGASQLWAQSRTLTGKVVDEKGNPLAGATVSAKGTDARTQTGADGSFSLKAPESAKQIEITYVGYVSQTITIGKSNTYSISLTTNTNDAGEVVVTGYQRVKRSEYSGAAAKVDKKSIEFVPMGSFDQILQGRVPGLLVTSTSGQPGASAAVMLRGMTSILGGTTPLYVVDGVPVEAGVFQSYNPNDFESVDVLKDAAASALYGSRGAAGVIVVTTKKGKTGKTVLSYSAQAGITQAGKQQFDMMNSAELLKFQETLGSLTGQSLPGWNLSAINPANTGLPASQLAANARALDSMRNINTDWRDVFFRQGSFYSHDLSLSGGTDRTRFYASLGSYKEDGIGLRSDLDRKTFRLNVDHSTDKLTFSLNSGFGYSERNRIESEGGAYLANPFAAVYLALPYDKPYDNFGKIAVGSGKTGANALQRVFDTEAKVKQLKGNLNATATYAITKNVYVGGQAGLDYRNTYNVTVIKPVTFTAYNSPFPAGPATAGDTTTARGSYTETEASQFNYQVRAFAGFKKVFANKHNFDGSINVEYIKRTTRGVGVRVFGLNPRLPITPANYTVGNINNQLIPAAANAGNGDTRLFSTFGLFKYTYNDKYTLDFNLRNDNSSLLPSKNRSKFFYGLGTTWNILKENFTANWKKVSTLRLRASYGTSANANNFPIGPGAYYATYGQGSYAGLPTYVEVSPGNPDIDWEYTKQLNIGVDFGFFSNRLTGTVDVYNKITDNLFLTQSVSGVTGAAATAVNSGSMRNRGVEVSLSYDIIRNRDVTWRVGANYAYNQNTITSLAGASDTYTDLWGIAREGSPYGSFYLTQWGGVDAATGAPLYKTKDGKLTNVYSDNEAVVLGTYLPPHTGGFNTSVSFKGIELSAFFTFQRGNVKFNRQNFFQMNHAFANQGFNLRREMLSMWTKPGDVTNYQSPLYQVEQGTSKFLEDASYLRFRNLQIGYTIPKSVLGRQKIVSSVKIFGQAQNLFTWTKFTGFDPEAEDVTDLGGADDAAYSYPSPRTYTIGINVIF